MRGFDRFELEVGRGTLQALTNDTPASAAEWVVAARVAFLDKPGSLWRGRRPQVVVWFQGWQEMESLMKTCPDINRKTGESCRMAKRVERRTCSYDLRDGRSGRPNSPVEW
jgi:hypothetical protein